MKPKQFMIRVVLPAGCLLSMPLTFVDAQAGVMRRGGGGGALLIQKTFRPYSYFSLVRS